MAVGLRHAQAREVEPAAIIEIKLLVLRDNGVAVHRRTKVQPALRHASDHAGLSGERDVRRQAFLVGDRGHAFGHANPQIHHALEGQLDGTAPGDDLACVKRHGGLGCQGDAGFSRERGIVGGAIRLAVQLRLGDDNTIHQDPRNDDLPRAQALSLGKAFDLDDDAAAGVLGRSGDGQAVERQGFALHGDVARRVGGGAAQQGDVNRERAIVEPLLPIEILDAHKVFRRAVVDLAAAVARIDEGAGAHFGEEPGPVSGDLAEELGDHPERQIVGLDLVMHRELRALRHQGPVAADGAPDEALVGQAIEAARLAVPGRGREDECQVAGTTGLHETRLECGDKGLWSAGAHEPGECNGVAIADARDRPFWCDQLRPHLRLLARSPEARSLPRVRVRRSAVCPETHASSTLRLSP